MDCSPTHSGRKQVATYLDPETAARLKRAADRASRSVSSYVEYVLRRQLDLEAKVYGPAELQEPHR